ncbi:AraC family transcriptional regulator [Agaribacterium haliotis]|uniref:AraC family transcriptional regulator n=1 Tax=Agaribacterium haliotis TaxID=2013869 RepID=UPI000BB567E6|nr:AraC family transcriptional regulator [Agaribacterium haliotis]
MAESSVPVAYVEQLLNRAEQQGCRIDLVLQQLGFSRAKLLQQELRAKTYGDLYRLIILDTQNEWFGLFNVGGKVPLGSFRMMALTLLQCSCLEQAIRRANDFAAICRGMNTTYQLRPMGERTTLHLVPSRAVSQEDFDAKLQKSDADEVLTSLLTWHRFSEWLIDKEIPALDIKLSFDEDTLKQPLAFGAGAIDTLRFNQESNALCYHSSFLQSPIVQNQESLHAFLRSAPYHLVTEDPAHLCMEAKVRSIINRDINHLIPSAEHVARCLGISVSTMRRQLVSEASSYQKIKDECRLEAAKHFLSYAELSNSDIAQRLGFDEPSAFFRSFKKWTGLTPGEYRVAFRLHE